MRDLVDFIKVYRGVVSNELCDTIISEYPDSDFTKAKIVQNGKTLEDNYERNCKSTSMLNNKNPYREQLDKYMYDIFGAALKEYIKDNIHYKFELSSDSGYDLLKYETGGLFTYHYDQVHAGSINFSMFSSRVMSCVALLNDDFEGGELAFFAGENRYAPGLKKGDVILFPSNFLYPHEVTEVTKGTRYSIVTWFT